MSLNERLQEDKANSIDRRRISQHSERKLAEAIHHNEPEKFAGELFHILSGEYIEDNQPWREINVEITLDETIDIDMSDKTIVGKITIGGEAQGVYLNDFETQEYELSKFQDGNYTLSVSFDTVREYTENYLETTEYEIETITVENNPQKIVVDSETTDIVESVMTDPITISEFEMGEEY